MLVDILRLTVAFGSVAFDSGSWIPSDLLLAIPYLHTVNREIFAD
jgi:hypothetical protein